MGFVIGTAGHIDHGKTALVRALTGQDTDQLKAEKERGISIDLGFARYELPNGTPVGIVDVPGHERFIRNMVAGAHGIDLVLFVIAADDGVMPQTEEHFDILQLLEIRQAIFVVTKIDRVAKDRFAEVAEEIELLAEGSPFEGASVLAVSNTTGVGVETLKSRIATSLNAQHAVPNNGAFRMPVDRVFTIHGRGVVITGTAISGNLSVGQEITCQPDGKTYRVRGLQAHGQNVEQGGNGQRLAINLSAAERKDFQRGDVVCEALIANSSSRIDVRFSIFQAFRPKFKNGQRVRLHLGTAERFGVIVKFCDTGEQADMAQITLTEPLHVLAGDRFILRDEQGEHTLGGGSVLDPLGLRLRRSDPARLEWLTALKDGRIADAIGALCRATSKLGLLEEDLVFRLNKNQRSFDKLVARHSDIKLVEVSRSRWICDSARLKKLKQEITIVMSDFHKKQPLQPGLKPDDLHRLTTPLSDQQLFQTLLDQATKAGLLKQRDAIFALPDHQPNLTENELTEVEKIITKLLANPFSPPDLDHNNSDQRNLISYLERQNRIVRVGGDILFATSAVQEAGKMLSVHFADNDAITAAEFRDLLGTSRKYALALLETFDRAGHTIRIGDIRKRGKPPEN